MGRGRAPFAGYARRGSGPDSTARRRTAEGRCYGRCRRERGRRAERGLWERGARPVGRRGGRPRGHRRRGRRRPCRAPCPPPLRCRARDAGEGRAQGEAEEANGRRVVGRANWRRGASPRAEPRWSRRAGPVLRRIERAREGWWTRLASNGGRWRPGPGVPRGSMHAAKRVAQTYGESRTSSEECSLPSNRSSTGRFSVTVLMTTGRFQIRNRALRASRA